MMWILNGYIKKHRKTFIYSGVFMLISLTLLLLSRNNEDFAQWYSSEVYPIFPNSLGRLLSPLPFSIFEIGLYIAFMLFIVYIFKILWMVLHKSPKLKSILSKGFTRGICILSSLFLVFTLTGSINYSRSTFASSTGLPIQNYTQEELTQLSILLIKDIESLVSQVNVDKNGFLSIDQKEINKEAVKAMKNLGKRYNTLSGYYPNTKPILLSKAMSYLGITGIYSPFTLEANYNRDVASFIIPYTICHELSHLKGYMREEEAGFIAYLACRDSNSKALQYSGAVNALIYTLNSIHINVSAETFLSVYSQIPEQVKMELENSRYYWEKHTVPITSIAKAANDQYLIANAQTSGTKSYGKMVDLLLAEYADKLRENELL